MSDTTSTNKRVAKNTLILYVRMFITMAIGIWTSRLVINALGFTDQGLYNLVGGFVGMLSLVSSSISTSISRFLTYEIGRGNMDKVSEAYRTANAVQLCLSIIVVVLAETVGLWFMNHKLVIPEERFWAVHIVYQLSVANFVMGLMCSPQSALIIAYERMSIYAYTNIFNSVATLGIAIAIAHTGFDRLVLYATLLFALSLAMRVFFIVYIRSTCPEVKRGYSLSKEYFRPIFSFAGWSSLGMTAGVLRGSGISVLLNMFGGPIANTVNGIASSVGNFATIFIKDFTTAYSPQIIKKYSRGDYPELNLFLIRCSKFTFCMMMVMAVPIIVNVEPLLILWLKKIPEGTVVFSRLIILCTLVDTLSYPLMYAAAATGNIKKYQIVVGSISLLVLPLAYVFLKCGLPLYFSYVAMLITFVIALIGRMFIIPSLIPGWSNRIYLTSVVFRCLLTFIVCLALQILLNIVLPQSVLSAILQCFIGFTLTSTVVLVILCDQTERTFIIDIIKKTTGKMAGLFITITRKSKI